VALLSVTGCFPGEQQATVAPSLSKYPTLEPLVLPDYLKGTVMERVEVQNIHSQPVSGFGLVVNLAGTGDTSAPTPVREYIERQMIKRGFGSTVMGYERMQPGAVLRDPRVAIVRVDAFVPPGARPGDRIDLLVSTLDNNNTTSLARGLLYRTDLKINGANPQKPSAAVDVPAYGEGAIFVNPAYASGKLAENGAEMLKRGVVIGGGVVQIPRAIHFRIREPSARVARMVEARLDQAFQDTKVAAAQDDGIVLLRVPERFGDDWERFVEIARHTFFNTSEEFVRRKSVELAQEAVKPDAPLLDITYCWEALGPAALDGIRPMLTHERPDVAFSAARAAAHLGDQSAAELLERMALDAEHPFSAGAVDVLAELRPSPLNNQRLQRVMRGGTPQVRIAAYEALARRMDSSIHSENIESRFMLDFCNVGTRPILYAARTGLPRIAVLGTRPRVRTPLTFTAMDTRLSITAATPGDRVTIFYRGSEHPTPIRIESTTDLAEVIARLGGAGPRDQRRLDFTYGDVVAVVKALVESGAVIGTGGTPEPAVFVLQSIGEDPEVASDATDQPDATGLAGSQGAAPADARGSEE
jgi:hypothetical protein